MRRTEGDGDDEEEEAISDRVARPGEPRVYARLINSQVSSALVGGSPPARSRVKIEKNVFGIQLDLVGRTMGQYGRPGRAGGRSDMQF